MFHFLRLNILIYTCFLIFQVLFLGIVNDFLFILFAHIVLDLFDYMHA